MGPPDLAPGEPAERAVAVVLLGPHGSGRSTPLRASAGTRDPARPRPSRSPALHGGALGQRTRERPERPVSKGAHLGRPWRRGRAPAAHVQSHPQRHGQPRLRPSGGGPGRGEPVRVRDVLRGAAALLRRGRGLLRVRQPQLLLLLERLESRHVLHPPHRPPAAGAGQRGRRGRRVRRPAAQHHDSRRREAHGAHAHGVVHRRARRGHPARARGVPEERRHARRRHRRAVHELLCGPRSQGLARRRHRAAGDRNVGSTRAR